MAKRPPSKKRIVAEPLEDRLLFSATTDFVLLDEGLSDVHDLSFQAENTNLLDVLQLPDTFEPEDTPALTESEHDAAPRQNFEGELIFVDSRIDNVDQLIDDLQLSSDGEFEIFLLDGEKDGVEQISLVLAQYSGVKGIHLISHGSQGRVSLGDARLANDTLQDYEEHLAGWANALDEQADILIYGCNLTANEAGQNLINQIADITGADVAASNDETGAESLGGDWLLENQRGSIETSALYAPGWEGLLAATAVDDTITIWYDEAITGNLFTGDGGSGIQADSFTGTGQLVSVTYNSVLYNSFDGDGNITINADDGTFVINQDGTYTYTTSYLSTTVGNNTAPDWNSAFNMYGYTAGTAYASGSVLDTSFSSATTVLENYWGLGISGGPSNSLDNDGGNTEAIVIDTQGAFQLQTVTTGGLTASESVRWQAFDYNGNQVDTGTFSGSGGEGDSEISLATIETSAEFQYLVFTAVNAGDEFLINQISLANAVPDDEIFSYVVEDSADSGQDTGLLTISYVDDNQDALAWYSGDINVGDEADVGFTTDDPDGRSGTTTYQWQRSVDGATWLDISGETSSNYFLSADDLGMYVRAEIVFTDDEGTMERLASPSSAVQVRNGDGSGGAALFSGIEAEGETLSGSIFDESGASGTINYQWQRSADGSTGWSDISGATSSDYVLTSSDVGQYVRLTADYTDDASNPENVQSIASGEIAVANSAGSVSISGTAAEDQVLTATVTDSDGSSGNITYLWQFSANGSSGWSTLQYTSSETYLLTDAESNGYVRVTASYTDDRGFSESATSSNTAQIAATNDGSSIAISGSTSEDQTLTATVTDGDGASGSITYNWAYSADGISGWTTVQNTTSNTYTLTDSEVGGYVRVTASYTDDQGFAETPVSSNTAQISAVNDGSSVAISGTATEDQTLTATVTDADGASGSITYNWAYSADGISGWTTVQNTTANTYTLTDSEVGGYVRVTASYTDDQGFAETPVSSNTAQISAVNDGSSVAISGTATEDQTLTATVTDADGASGSITYNWAYSADGISGWTTIQNTTANTYTLTDSEVGGYVRVTATYTDDQGFAETPVSSNTTQIAGVNDGSSVAISGTATEDQTLTATVTDTDGASGSITYNWEYSADGISGWTTVQNTAANTYTLTDSEVGGYVRVTASYTDDQGFTETPVSSNTTQIAGVNDGSSVAISGTATEDQTLTATVTDTDGASGSITYNWEYSADGISGWTTVQNTTANTYTLTDSEVGGYVRVSATYTDDQGFAETPVSSNTAQISAVNDGSSVAVSGTATEDQTLTATVTDTDGTSGSITYNWEYSADGISSWTTVQNTTANTYTLTDSEVGGYVRVTATYTDDQGFSETPTSSNTAQIGGVNDGSSVAISGTTTEDQTLTATVTDADGASGSITYNWEYSADGSTGWSTVQNTTSNTYTLTDSEVGGYVRVTATYTDDQGFSETPTSSNTAQIGGVNDGSSVAISGTATEDQTLTATVTDTDGASGSITYNWEYSSDGSTGWSTVQNTTSNTYTLTDSEVGGYVRVTATYTDDQGFSETPVSSNTAQITGVNDGSSVAISGTATEDQSLTATVTDTDGASGSITYNWEYSADGISSWTTVQNTTANTYTLTDSEVGGYVRVTATYTDDQGFAETPVSSNTAQISAVNDGSSVAISGTATEDQTLTATVTDNDGASGSITYNWEYSADGSTGWTTVQNTTANTYTLTDSEVGGYVRVTATYTDDQGFAETPVSSNTTQIAGVNDGSSVAITGTATEDQTLTATVTDNDGASGSITYNWEYSADGISGWTTSQNTTANTYTLTDSEVGGYVRVTASYTDDQGFAETPVSSNTAQIGGVNDGSSVAISGTATEDQTLTATVTDTDGASGSITYNWEYSADGISGWTTIQNTTANTYTLTDSEVGGYVRVTATYTDDQGFAETPVSSNTTQIAGVNDGSSVAIVGTIAEDETITANLTDDDGASGTISYLWEFSTDGSTGWTPIQNSTANTYTLGDAEVGGYIRVTASYTDDQGFAEAPVSLNSGQVGNVNDPASVSFSGIEAEDETLTAAVSDNDGASGPVSYQWQRSADGSSGWSAISGATSANYTLIDTDVGQYVRVSANYVDDQGTTEVTISAASGQITNVNDPGSVSISGTTTEDQTLTATVADIDGASGSISYNWEYSADGSSGWATIQTGTSNSYTLSDADVDGYIRVTATYTDDRGFLEAPVSANTAQITAVNDGSSITISGTTTEDQTLTATVSDVDGASGSIIYNWEYSANGSTGWSTVQNTAVSTFTLSDSEVGGYVRVTATYIDDQGFAETPVSVNTAQISAVNDGSSVAISGTATEDQTLTATVTDADGASGSITYNWAYSADGISGWTTVQNTTANTYTLTDSEVGGYVRVTATYTDDQGFAETPVSSNTTQIAGVNDGSSVAISGTATEDQTLTATVTDTDGASASITYNWEYSADGISGWTTIQNTTANTYTLTDSEVGGYVRVTATYTDDQGFAETPVSSNTTQIAGVNDGSSVAISGTATEDQTLTATVTDTDGASGSITYNWEYSADGISGWTTVQNTTANTYTLTDSEVGGYVRVSATYTDDQGFAETPVSSNTAQISAVNDGSSVAVSGTATEDQTLTATVTDTDGTSGSITYNWEYSADGISSWTTVQNTTANTYTLTDSEVGGYVRVTASYTDDQGFAETPVSSNTTQIAGVNDGSSVAISGTATEDQTLTATVTDTDGASGSITYNWQYSADGISSWTTVQNTTANTYTLTDSEVGGYVRVTASYTDDQGFAETTLSSSTTAVSGVNDSAAVSITGSNQEDQTITAIVSDPDGTSGAISYNWEYSANGSSGWTSIQSSAANTYTLSDSEVGGYVRVTASYTDDQGFAETPVSANTGQITAVNDDATISLTGTAQEDETLTAIVSDTDGTSGSITYNWESSANGMDGWVSLQNTSSNTYTLSDAEVGTYIRVSASYTDDQGFSENPLSSNSAQIGAVNDGALVALSGTAQEHQTLSATVIDADGVNGPVTYLWEVSANGTTGWTTLQNSSATTYTLDDSEVGSYVRVTASYTDNQGFAETPVSTTSSQVLATNDGSAISISGTASEHQTLTATLADTDGSSGAIQYNWQYSADGVSNWVSIQTSGANSYVLTPDEVGGFIRVSASYTDDQGFAETPVSASTQAIGAVNDGAAIAISGTPEEDQTLTAILNDADGASGSVSYHWEFSVNGSSAWQSIQNNASNTYTLTDAEVGGFVRVTAIYTDDQGFVEAPVSVNTAQVSGINDSPQLLNPLGNQQANEDSAFQFQLPGNTFYDPDGDTLALSASLDNGNPLPAWLQFNSATNTFSGTPEHTDTGTLLVRVSASDSSGATTSTTFNLQVNAVNDAPLVSGLTSHASIEDSADESIDLGTVFSDEEDGTSLSYRLLSNSNTVLLSRAEINNSSGDLELGYSSNQWGSSELRVEATDSQGASVIATITVNVDPVNDSPTTHGIDDIEAVSTPNNSSTVELADLFSDPEDGTDLSYSVVGNSNPDIVQVEAVDSENQQIVLVHSPQASGEAQITVRATDSEGGYVETSFKVTLVAPPITTVPDTPDTPTTPTEPEPEPEQPKNEAPGTPTENETQTPAENDTREDEENSVRSNTPSSDFNALINLANNLGSTTGTAIAFELDTEYNGYDSSTQKPRDLDSGNQPENQNQALGSMVSLPGSYLSEQDIADFNDELKKLKTDMAQNLEQEKTAGVIYKGITVSITTGLVVWLLRAGSLLLTLFSLLPVWKGLDPLPVVTQHTRRNETLKQSKDKQKEDAQRKEVGYLFDKTGTKTP